MGSGDFESGLVLRSRPRRWLGLEVLVGEGERDATDFGLGFDFRPPSLDVFLVRDGKG